VGPESGEARMYVCGITPYDATHLGHAATYVAFDLLNRTWRDRGLDVHYVQNVTDIDDPLLERARATGVDWTELARAQTDLFRSDMEALRVLPPREYVGAVEAIPLVVDAVEALGERGLVYRLDPEVAGVEAPDWYFRSRQVPHYGAISHLSEEQARVIFAERGGDPDLPGKVDPFDCLVWRMAREGEPSWESRLGPGRPGWHIECSVIAQHYLGTTFDVQGGGSDLAFPHHEMSAAEGRAATGQRYAQAYVHAGMVGLDGEKMSKSRGNLVLVSRLTAAGVDPMAIRLAILAHHYRDDWSWTDAGLLAAIARLDTWCRAVAAPAGPDATATVAAVRAALRDDLDAPAALAAIDAWAAATLAGEGTDPTAPGLLARAADALLGVTVHAGGCSERTSDSLDRVKTFESLFAELQDKAVNRPDGSGTVAELDAGVHQIGKKIVEEAGEVWMAAEYEGKDATALEISQLLYHAQVMMIATGLTLEDVYRKL